MNDTRLVPLTHAQREVLVWAKNHLEAHAADTPEHRVMHGQFLLAMSQAARDAVTAWDAAPTDSAEAAVAAYAKHMHISDPRVLMGAVLAALGMPTKTSRDTKDTT